MRPLGPIFSILLFLAPVSAAEPDAALKRHEFEAIRMGVPVRVILYSEDAEQARSAGDAALRQFETLNAVLSDYDSESELSRLSRRSDMENGPRIPVGDDLFAVLQAAKHYSEISDGAFDITVGPFVRLWRRSKRQRELPKQRHLDRARELVGRHLWELDATTRSVRFCRQGMRLDLGGIAKGYAIDRAFETVRDQGISIVLIDAGGDIRVGEEPPGGWTVELENGRTIFLKNSALATSGDSKRFVEIDGRRYSHLIDPKTGLGLTTPCTVHVAAPTAMEADAIASILAVLGPEKGMPLAEAQNNVSAKIVFGEDAQVFRSKNWAEIEPEITGK